MMCGLARAEGAQARRAGGARRAEIDNERNKARLVGDCPFLVKAIYQCPSDPVAWDMQLLVSQWKEVGVTGGLHRYPSDPVAWDMQLLVS